MRFFASCARGLEYLLADECTALGCTRATAATAGVNVEGSLQDAQRLVLWSRLASRILWPIAEFDCTDEAALYGGAQDVDWARHLPESATFAVDAHVSGPELTHAQFAALRVKDAIVDRLRAETGHRPDVDVESPDVRLNLVVRKGKAVLSIDLGSGALHRRGWRGAQGDAPLKENLAAAVLARGGWPAPYLQGGGLLDPMCGSGTLLIEGALMAADVAPGLQRHGQGLPSRWTGFDVAGWNALCADARERARVGLASLRPVFHGSDADANVIRSARGNAESAGVLDAIDFAARDISDVPAPAEAYGLVVCNPPYDVRLAATPALYRSLGESLKRATPEWGASLLCGDEDLARATGLRWRKLYPLRNGALECALLVCASIRPPVPEGVAAAGLSDGATMVANRIRKTLKASRTWRDRDGVTCWRAYDADIPEYAAAVDVYTAIDDPRPWLHVQEYAAPADIPEDVARRRLADLLAAVREVFGVERERVALKTRRIAKGGSKYGQMDQRGETLRVREGDAILRVNLFDYLDTGLFLDHRPLRMRIARESRGKRFLNLFCYTGATTVHAALGGATVTTSVDLSGTYLQWLADNLRENGLGGVQHALVQADAMSWLRAERAKFDLVFCDPPTFSNSKRAGDFDVQREHVELLRLAMDRLTSDGVLYFSNNARRFKLDVEAIRAFAEIEDISPSTIPPDFARNPRIHRAWRLRHPAT